MRARARHALVAAGAAALIAPSAAWISAAWADSPQDRPGPLFAGLALAWWVAVVALARPRQQGFASSAWPLVALLALVGAAGQVLDVRLLVAAAGVGLTWGLGWGLYGAGAGLLLLPSLVMGLFALPTTGFLIDELWLSLGLVSPGSLGVKLAVSVAMVALAAVGLLLHARGRRLDIAPVTVTYAVLCLVAAAGLLVALRPPQFGPPVRLDEEQWAFGGWLGAEIAATPSEELLFAQTRLSKRAYARRDGARVAVLVVESDDIHRLHTPEYCLTGSGWRMRQRATSRWPVGTPAAAAAELKADRGGDELMGVYWFTSDSRSTTDLAGLRLQHRLAPDEDFTLYMVTAIDAAGRGAERVLADFVHDAPWLSPGQRAKPSPGNRAPAR